MESVIAIDPGVGRNLGWAVFASGRLIRTGLGPDYCAMRMTIDTAVIEIPQVYARSKGDPNDLITIAFEAGRFIGKIHTTELILVKPRQWKGQVPKEIHQRRILAALRDGEPVPKVSHEIDAVGLGLWHLGRLV